MGFGKERGRVSIVLGVIGSDCHAVGNAILDRFFSGAGFRVVNLGVMVPEKEFIAAAVETASPAILVSSLYGHAELDCRGLRAGCVESGIGDVLLYIGGNLVVGALPFSGVRKKFREMGFDRVFPADADLERALKCLREDLRKKGVL